MYGVDTDETEQQAQIGQVSEESYEKLKTVFAGKSISSDTIEIYDEKYVISAYVPIKSASGEIIAVMGCDYDAQEMVATLKRTKVRVVLIGAVFGILAIGILTLCINKILKSLITVDRKIYDIVHNEGDLTQHLEIQTGDEMELIANNVNTLLAYIRGIMKEISVNAALVEESSKNVVSHLSQTEISVTDVSATMEEMSATMEETTASLNQINETTSEVFCGVENISTEAAEQIKQVSFVVIEAVNALAKEAETMITFLNETAMGGYQKLMETSENYRDDAGTMYDMMKEFSEKSDLLKKSMEKIKETISTVNVAIEESTKGVSSVSEVAVGITGNVTDIEEEANNNMEVVKVLNSQVNKFKLE